ncbi:TRL domain-containing protein [uncultured Marinobacter sp.]|uniref:TRL domain-containing protein n=1 Tax=uncultured Marinobacter sp. TaxID=187379 RepID=UPI00260E8F80|nr:TRL domain-containing protein [uncultured Marinobacter sp.]
MKKAFVAAILAVGLSGCSAVAMNSGNTADLNQVDFQKEFKTGEACETSVLLFGPFGYSSVVDAAKNGGISKVEVVEQRFNSYILFGQRCTVVYGE